MNKENIAQSHRLLSRHILVKYKQGKLRTQNMYVSDNEGRIEYVAATPFELQDEMEKFYTDIAVLIQTPLTIQEVFYFAAMIHLLFVKIHPWNDGNGRTGRLLEKWFLAQRLSEKAWFIQSEKNYYVHHQIYYNNIRRLGLEYADLDYFKAMPFLLMLPNAIIK